jgi:hypothetical protein
MQMKRIAVAVTILSMLFAGAVRAEAPGRETLTLVANGEARCTILCDLNDALSSRTAAKLSNYLSEQVAAKPRVVGEQDLNTIDRGHLLIVIDGSENQRLLTKVGVQADVPTDRADALSIKATQKADRWVIALAGRTPAGAKYATYRLMEEMQIEGHDARVAALDLRASPFFPTRSVSLFNIWRVPVETIRQCNIEAWPLEKVQRNIDTYDAFGFNAIETHDRFHEDFLKGVYGISRAEWREKVYAMCDRAHADGMTVFLRLWGNSVALPVKEVSGNTPFGFVNLAPDIPEERKRWESEIRDYASKTYASHIDHLIGHWADAGGVHPGSQATVKDSMLLHNELVTAFRAINPNVQSTFNLWGMANPRGIRGWPGYEDHRSICDAGILPKDVAIAQTTRSHSHVYSAQVTSDILAAGHPAAVWTWRRADTEVRFGDAGLRIRVRDMMGEYFNNLPESARQLQWHNIERNHHGLANDVNYYVAGKLMWDSKADVDALLSKYCQLVFGQANAAAVVEAFNTIEWARHPEQFVSEGMLADPSAGARRAGVALEALNGIVLPQGHRSRLPSVTTPQEMLQQLRDTLAVIAENGRIIATELPAIESLLKSGKADEAKAKAAALETKADEWLKTIAGGVEGHWLKESLKQKSASATTQTSSFGLIARNISVLKPLAGGGGFVIGTSDEQPGVALIEMKQPTDRATEFRFRFKAAQKGMQNGGFAFGPSLDKLTRCQALVRGRRLMIRDHVSSPAREDVPELDPAAEQECLVRVDPAKRAVRFTVGKSVVEATLSDDSPIRFYGYVVEQTISTFSPIELNESR